MKVKIAPLSSHYRYHSPRDAWFPALVVASACAFGAPGAAHADATDPKANLKASVDTALLKRYEGSFIVSYDKRSYGELAVPLAPLKASANPDERDGHNNRVFRPERSTLATGTVSRLVYVIPPDRSPLEVLRNYQDEIAAKGDEVVFECHRDACGGDPNRASSGGGGRMSLVQNFLYESDVKDAAFSNGSCALTQHIDDLRYLTARIPQGSETAWVTVHTYLINSGTYCKALNGRTVALVHVVEPKSREQRMVTVKAEQMARAIDAEGSISLYGIYFDTNEARIKPESEPALQEIAKLLASQPQLARLVVGHTDNQGSFEHNLALSNRRAQAVRAALASRPGVDAKRLTAAGAGMMAPVATNATEEGRARNRRVAIVRANAP